MKIATKILLALCLALLLTGCGDKPAAVAEKFSMAMVKGNFEEAKKYATENTGQLIDFVAALSEGADNKEALSSGADFKFVLVKEEIEGDKATVFFKNDTEEKVESLTLIKQDGKWKADIPKQ